MRGHLQCRDTLAGNEGCPLKTGTTVDAIIESKVDIKNVKSIKDDPTKIQTSIQLPRFPTPVLPIVKIVIE